MVRFTVSWKSLTHAASRGGGAQASVYSPENHLLGIQFDCKGHMIIFNGLQTGPLQYVPPRSVAGRNRSDRVLGGQGRTSY
jgi:hypothetical protein